MRFALFLPPQANEMWRLAVQLGVTDAVTGLPRQSPGGPLVWDFSSLLHLKQRFADAGLTLSVIEIRCGDVVTPTLVFAERHIDSRNAHTDPFPFVPATWIS